MENICKEVGARIRYFRKRQGYTLTTFAAALHRSRSVVSQYERGEISIDLMTLQQISIILRIPLSALVDGPLNAARPLFSRSPGELESIENMRKEYIYTYFSHAKAPILRVHLLCYNEGGTHVVLYTYPTEKVDGSAFQYFYSGQLVKGASFTRLLLNNPVVDDDLLLFEFPIRFKETGLVMGFLASLSIGSYFPLAAAALLSPTVINDRDWLLSCLSYDRKDMKLNKQQNCFFISQDKDHFLHSEAEQQKKLRGIQ